MFYSVLILISLWLMIAHSFHIFDQQCRFNSLRMRSEPKSPLEITRANALKNMGSVATAAAILAPTTAAFAYGDADELQRKKKPGKDKIIVQETDLGIPYLVQKKGSGAYPNPGDYVAISYIGFLSDGSIFDSTEVKGRKALGFKMGAKQVIPGLESVIEQLQNGAEATCSIPAKYAYGSKGVCLEKDGKKECLIPPNENLKYFIKVKTVGSGYN